MNLGVNNPLEEQKRRILVVTANTTDLHYIGKLVHTSGHEALLAESADDALPLVDTGVDLIIADSVVPDMDGFDMIRQIRETPAAGDVPVIMITSLSERQERLKAVTIGINDFITRPVDIVELSIRMNTMLAMKETRDQVKKYQTDLEFLVNLKTEELSNDLRTLKAVLDDMPDCMVTLDKHCRIKAFNHAFTKLTGLSEEKIKGASFPALLDDDLQLSRFRQLLSDKEPQKEYEAEFTQWNGQVFSILATPMETGDRILVMRDITGKKQAEDQKNRVLSLLSDELRTPLNGILGLSEFLIDDLKETIPEESMEFLKDIATCGNNMKTVINELLNFIQRHSSVTRLHKTNIDMEKLVTRIFSSLEEPRKEKNYTFELDIVGESPVFFGEKSCIEEAFRHIIDNALKFGNRDGKTEVMLKSTGESLHFICHDNGPGIPEESQDRVFDSFFQVDPATPETQRAWAWG